MTQLTLRGFGPELERRLRELARRNATSLNEAALLLMRRGAGLDAGGQPRHLNAGGLARYAGRMSAAAAKAVDRAVADLRQADLDMQP